MVSAATFTTAALLVTLPFLFVTTASYLVPLSANVSAGVV